MKLGFIYFAESGDLIKVGFSVDPIERLKALFSPSSEPIRLLGVIPNKSKEDEYTAHQCLAKDRVTGEWFKKSPELMDVIETMTEPPSVVNAYSRANAVIINAAVPKAARDLLKAVVARNGTTVQAVMRDLIDDYIKRNEKAA